MSAANYLRAQRPDHPLARSDGTVSVSRAALYDAIGPGAHPCDVCGVELSWAIVPPAPGALTVDHCNGSYRDNRRDNLRVLCLPCNGRDGVVRRHRRTAIAPEDVLALYGRLLAGEDAGELATEAGTPTLYRHFTRLLLRDRGHA
jgi:hypothetical protein